MSLRGRSFAKFEDGDDQFPWIENLSLKEEKEDRKDDARYYDDGVEERAWNSSGDENDEVR